MQRLLFIFLCVFGLSACVTTHATATTIEYCDYVRPYLSPDGKMIILMETSPSGFRKIENGYASLFKLQRTKLNCDAAGCAPVHDNLTFPITMVTPKILWTQNSDATVLGATILDQHHHQETIFIPNDSNDIVELNTETYALPNKPTVMFKGENWAFLPPLRVDVGESVPEPEINKVIKDRVERITQDYNDFRYDLDLAFLEDPYATFSQTNEGVIAVTRESFANGAETIVSRGGDGNWTQLTNFEPLQGSIKVYASDTESLILGGINRAVDISTSETSYLADKFSYSEAFRTQPVIDKSTGNFVGLSSLKSIRLEDRFTSQFHINSIIKHDLASAPNLTLDKVELAKHVDGTAYVIQYRNWRLNRSQFKYVTVGSGKDRTLNINSQNLPCPEGRKSHHAVNSESLEIAVENIGSKEWPLRVLSLTQDAPKGALVFLMGGPGSTPLDGVLPSRVYDRYIKLGFDVYALEYSGMTLLHSRYDTRLAKYHEKALEKDLAVISGFIERDLKPKYAHLRLHSESFGSILALGLLQNRDLFHASVFSSPWILHHSPEAWKDDPNIQFAYEKYLFGINEDGKGAFIDWMLEKRRNISMLENSLVIIGDKENRSPLQDIVDYFNDKGADVQILKNITHELAPAVSGDLIVQHLEQTLETESDGKIDATQ